MLFIQAQLHTGPDIKKEHIRGFLPKNIINAMFRHFKRNVYQLFFENKCTMEVINGVYTLSKRKLHFQKSSMCAMHMGSAG